MPPEYNPPSTQTEQSAPTESGPSKSKTKGIIAAIVGAIVILVALGVVAFWFVQTQFLPESPSQPPSAEQSSSIQYLLFQVASLAPSPVGTPSMYDGAQVQKQVDDILAKLGGERGDHVKTQLGYVEGPLSFDATDEEIRKLIRGAFAMAEEKDIAVGFHIDDSMFWAARKDLWSVRDNVEWTDWEGTVVPHRIIGWVANGAHDFLAPPMCYNSPAIIAEVKRRITDVIAPEIVQGVDRLESLNKTHLFAGVIAGWETHIQDEGGIHYGTYGYCALHNLGYSASNPPKDFDTALAGVVNDWIVLWTKGLYDAGIPREKIYTHIAYGGEQTYGQNTSQRDFNKQNPHSTAFNDYSYPGFSVYGTGFYPGLYKLLDAHGGGPWGIAEGTAVGLQNAISGGTTGPSEMEQYLAGAFNHGAIYVNIFGWSDNGSEFENATVGPGAIAAYRKFLEEGVLVEAPPDSTTVPQKGLGEKIQTVMSKAPAWMQAHPDRQSELQALLEKLEGYAKANNAKQTEETADEILRIINP